MLFDLSGLSTLDCLRSGALIVAFLATVFSDKKGSNDIWLCADNIASAVFGLALLCFPSVLLGYQTNGSLDEAHLHLARAQGTLLLGTVVTWHFTPRTKGGSTTSLWLLSKMVGAGSLLSYLIITQSKLGGQKPGLSQQNVSFTILGCALWLLGHAYHLFRLKDFGSRVNIFRIGDRMSVHVFIDLLFILPEITIYCINPQIMNNYINMKDFRQNSLHVFLLRGLFMSGLGIFHYGILLLLTSQGAAEKRAYFMGRALMMVVLYILAIYYHLVHQMFTATSFYWMLGISLFPLINTFAAVTYKKAEEA